jgi:hypothetical protein
MKNVNSIYFAIASAGFISLLSFPAIADSSTPATLEQMVQANTEKQLAAEGKKYTRIVTLAGNRQDELTTRKNEGTSTYKMWRDLKFAVVSHYPSSRDYEAVEMASKTYSQANKAFIDLQKTILAQNGVPLDTVSINTLNAAAPTAAGMK